MRSFVFSISLSVSLLTSASALAMSLHATEILLLDGIYDTRDTYCSVYVQINPKNQDLYAEAFRSLRPAPCRIEGQVFDFHYIGNGRFATPPDADVVTSSDLRNCRDIWWCRALQSRTQGRVSPRPNDLIEVRTIYTVINAHSFLNDLEVRLLRDNVVVQDWFISGATTLYSRRYHKKSL